MQQAHADSQAQPLTLCLSQILLQAAAFVFLSVGLEVAVGGWTTVYSTKWLGETEAEGHKLTSGAFAAA
jgi:fucose permease